MKTVVILHHNRGRLANQLWNAMSVYAYCLARHYRYKNYCFYDYASFFQLPVGSFWVRVAFYTRLRTQQWYVKLRPYYRFMQALVRRTPKEMILDSGTEPWQLPPTKNPSLLQGDALALAENSPYQNIYLLGGMFRNREGLLQYEQEIRRAFTPIPAIQKKVTDFLAPLRARTDEIVGVHIRQGDYVGGGHDPLTVTPEGMRAIMEAYLRMYPQEKRAPIFVLCSDGRIDLSLFKGLSCVLGPGSHVEDLFTLAATDRILGSDSTYGAFAGYYGNKPFVVCTKDAVDWGAFEDDHFTFRPACTTLHMQDIPKH